MPELLLKELAGVLQATPHALYWVFYEFWMIFHGTDSFPVNNTYFWSYFWENGTPSACSFTTLIADLGGQFFLTQWLYFWENWSPISEKIWTGSVELITWSEVISLGTQKYSIKLDQSAKARAILLLQNWSFGTIKIATCFSALILVFKFSRNPPKSEDTKI